MRSMYSAGGWVSFLESGWLGVISTNPVSFYWTNIPLVIKISLLIFIWQTFIFFQNKRWKKVYNLLSLLLLKFFTTNILFSAFETIMSSEVIETHSIFAEATNCNLKIVDWSCNFWQINARKNSCCKTRHQENMTAIVNQLFKKQISTGSRPVNDLWSDATQLSREQPKENPWSGLKHDSRTKTLSSQTSSSISLYLPMVFFVEPHLFSFLFAASVYFLLESRGKVILHNFWPH